MKRIVLFLSLCLCALTMAQAQSWIASLRQADRLMADGQWREAIRCYTSVIETTPDATARTECLQQRAACHKRLDEYEAAQADYETALASATNPQVNAAIRYNMTDLLMQTGQYGRAAKLLEGIHFADSLKECQRLANLSTAYAYRGETERALALLDKVIGRYPSDDANRARLLQNRGVIRWSARLWQAALADLQAALPSLQGNDRYLALANIAVVEAQLGQADSALHHIQQALDWQATAPGIGPRHSTYLISLRKKAEILLRIGKVHEAAQVFKRYFASEKEYVHTHFGTMTEQARLDFWQKENPLVSEMFVLGEQEAAFLYDVALFRRALALMGRRTAERPAALSGALACGRQEVARSLTRQAAAVEWVCYEDLLTGDSLYAALVCTPTQTRWVPIASKTSLHDYSVAGTTLQRAVCQGARYAQAIYNDSTLAAQLWRPVCQVLPPEVKRVYFATEGILQMLGVEYLPYPGAQRLDLRRVSSTASLCRRKTNTQTVKSERTGGKALVVGGLDYDRASSDHGELSPASTGLPHTFPNHMAHDMAVRLTGTSLVFPYLRGTVAEADTVAHLMHAQRQDAMGEALLKETLGSYGRVHLATHGYSLQVELVSPMAGLRDSLRHDNSLWASGIALTGANIDWQDPKAEDGLLSARELCELDLSQVGFVSLAACQTAQGVISDEGPAGVLRALKKAGAGTIVATLWAVSDKATDLFMKSFYRAWIQEGKEIHRAFRLAQQAVRDYAVAEQPRRATTLARHAAQPTALRMTRPFSSPRFWAPFILID